MTKLTKEHLEKIAMQNFRAAMEGIGHIRRTLDETFGGLHGTYCEPDVLVECKAICDAIHEAYRKTAPVTPDDVLRMDWLVSKTVDVREPMVYGSHSILWSQTITDEDDDYHATKLREQIDAARAAEQAAAPQQGVAYR